MIKIINITKLILVLISMSLIACEQKTQQVQQHLPVAIEQGDECHLCGMIITRFPGPKGEAFVRHEQKPLMFCSTMDLFSWLLQPETGSQVEAVFVHDMGQTPWDKPESHALIDARSAWYVVGSRRKGAMGETLASFAEQKQAIAFAKDNGGKLVRYEEVTLDMLQNL